MMNDTDFASCNFKEKNINKIIQLLKNDTPVFIQWLKENKTKAAKDKRLLLKNTTNIIP